jgi:GTPase SAR1 family protein
MNSTELAQYIEGTGGTGKSWLLVQLRLKKLAEAKPDLSPEDYNLRLEDIFQDMMNLGEWWVGIEQEVFE